MLQITTREIAEITGGRLSPDADPDTPSREILPRYFADYEIRHGLDVRRPVRVRSVRRPVPGRDDPAGDHDWGISAEVDLAASDEQGAAVVADPGFGVDAGPTSSVRVLRSTIRALRPEVTHSHLAFADVVLAATPGDTLRVSTEHGIAPDQALYQSSRVRASSAQDSTSSMLAPYFLVSARRACSPTPATAPPAARRSAIATATASLSSSSSGGISAPAPSR